MKIFGLNITREKKQQPRRRMYAGARNDNTTADWFTNNLASDEILRRQLPILRQRSRDLAENNDHMKNFLRKLKVNVIGPQGFNLQMKARLRNGNLDKRSNDIIEAAWKKFCKKQFASVCGTQSLRNLLKTNLESTARDGEGLIRKVKGYDNPFRFALQLIEPDHLDTNLNQVLPNGNVIKMGIEMNKWGKRIAYHLWTKHPEEYIASVASDQRRVVIPANEIVHIFIRERPSQNRAAPWAHTAIVRLRMLGAYEEAAVVNARTGAAQMGWIIESAEGGNDDVGDERLESGDEVIEIEPGVYRKLPFGTDIKEHRAQYPNGEFPSFEKAMLRGIASGIGCSYNSLANDLEGVNFSSLRSGLLDERDVWKEIQSWYIDAALEEIFPDWLEMAILTGEVPLSMADFERLNAPAWQARTWDWVDPVKDVNARLAALSAKLTSPQRVCAEQGNDLEEILEEWKEAMELAKTAGVEFNFKPASANKPNSSADEGDDNEPANEGGAVNGNGKKVY